LALPFLLSAILSTDIDVFFLFCVQDSLVEFRAGRLWKDSDSNMVRADKRKGMVIVKRSVDDQLIHFIWKDRTNTTVEVDLILFPDDAVWRRVKECTTGRVYVLEFKTGNRSFFWMQEPSAAKDDELSEALNDGINNRTPAGGRDAGLQSLLGQLGGGTGAAYDQLAQASSRSSASSGTGSSSTSTSTSTSTAGGSSASGALGSATSALSARLADVMNRLPGGNGASSAPQPRLTDVINTQEVLATGALQDEAVLAELQKFLPESERNSVIATLRSPQFRQAVDQLNAVLKQSPEALSTLLTSFGLQTPSEPAANRLETFLKAINEAAKKEEKKDENQMDES
jgi:26S proteasome regulatory subunit N13